ncbi:MAG: hypothetical protein H7067_04115 [Burkholderiales bacterium]|nr:hypothetical protein [Opitutaceae bacterium]
MPPALLDNPTAQLLLGAIKLENGDLNTDDGTLSSAWKKWPDLGTAPRALVWIAGVSQNRLGRYSRHKHPAPYREDALGALMRCLRDECATEDDQWLALTLPMRGYTLDVPFHVKIRYEELFAGAPAAIRALLLGEIEVQQAWSARGGGWASSVGQDSWRSFHHHLEKARVFYTSAIEAAPGRPLPLARMVEVAQLTSAPAPEKRDWLNRSLRAEPGCFIAWTHFLNSNLTRWGGSTESLQDFALEVARTMDWTTDLPLVFEKSLDVLQMDTKALNSKLISQGTMHEAWRAFLDSIPPVPPTDSAAGWRRANHFVFFQSYHAGNYEDALAVLRRFDPADLKKKIADVKENSVYSFDFLRANVLANTGPDSDRFRAAETAQATGEAREAARLFTLLADETEDPAARELIRHRAACATLQANWHEDPSANLARAEEPPPLGALKGRLEFDGREPRLSSPDDQNVIAYAWLKPDLAWKLSLVFDVKNQPDATTGLYWGTPDRGAGLLVSSPNGWGGSLLPARIRALSHQEVDTSENASATAPTRSLHASWDGHRLEIEIKAGETTWKHIAEPDGADQPAVWMLAILAKSKSGSLQPVPLKEFTFAPLKVSGEQIEPLQAVSL